MIRTPAGKWVKPDPEIIEELESNIIKFKVAIQRAEVLSTLRDAPGWKTAQDVLREKIKSIDYELIKFSEMNPRKIESLLQQKQDFQYLVDIVDDFEGSVDGFQAAIARNQKDIDVRKQSAGV